jgi:general secretion pathway protein A
MSLEFCGLSARPFGVTPDPKYLYMSPSHREALAPLYLAILPIGECLRFLSQVIF